MYSFFMGTFNKFVYLARGASQEARTEATTPENQNLYFIMN